MSEEDKARAKKYEEGGDAEAADEAARAKALDGAPVNKMTASLGEKEITVLIDQT